MSKANGEMSHLGTENVPIHQIGQGSNFKIWRHKMNNEREAMIEAKTRNQVIAEREEQYKQLLSNTLDQLPGIKTVLRMLAETAVAAERERIVESLEAEKDGKIGRIDIDRAIEIVRGEFMNDEKTQAAVERLREIRDEFFAAGHLYGVDRLDDVGAINLILAALDAANERAGRAEAAEGDLHDLKWAVRELVFAAELVFDDHTGMSGDGSDYDGNVRKLGRALLEFDDITKEAKTNE